MNVTRLETMQYILAEKRLEQLERRYQQKRNEVYDSVFGTRSVPDYELGFMYVESVNPVEVAIYLVELEEEHKREISRIKQRKKVFDQIKKHLTDEDMNNLNNLYTIRKIQKLLKDVVPPKENHIQQMRLYDEEIENMSENELLEEYIDFIGLDENEEGK